MENEFGVKVTSHAMSHCRPSCPCANDGKPEFDYAANFSPTGNTSKEILEKLQKDAHHHERNMPLDWAFKHDQTKWSTSKSKANARHLDRDAKQDLHK
jgi:hypothetical protein